MRVGPQRSAAMTRPPPGASMRREAMAGAAGMTVAGQVRKCEIAMNLRL
jgi:hypothetical protein